MGRAVSWKLVLDIIRTFQENGGVDEKVLDDTFQRWLDDSWAAEGGAAAAATAAASRRQSKQQ